jgi:hypothetical protein
MTTDFRAELECLVKAYADHGGSRWPDDDARALYQAVKKARAALAVPEQGPTDEEVDALVVCIQGLPVPDADDLALPSTGRGRDMVRRALARWGRPAVEPVPVAERVPGPEDCDGQGRCWWLDRPLKNGPAAWMLRRQDDGLLIPFIAWAPHWAIPVPQEGPMADLSPAAQAAWEAFNDVAERVGVFEDYGDTLAAFARVLADRMMYLIGDTYHPKYAEGIEAASDIVERIAAEMEA